MNHRLRTLRFFLFVLMCTSTAWSQNPKLLLDIHPGTASGTDMNSRSTGDIRAGVYYFGADNGTSGYELWRTDGTALGTWLVKDINSGIAQGVQYLSSIDCHNGSSGPLYFSGNNGTNGIELFKTDGTANGTVMVKNIFADKGSNIKHAQPLGFTLMNGITYFKAITREVKLKNSTFTYQDIDLYRTDGTAVGTSIVKDLAPSLPYGMNPSDMHVLNNVLYFMGNVEGVGDWRLCRSDGTANGTSMVYAGAELRFGWDARMEPSGTTLFFRADDGSHGFELWASDGSASGTRLVKDIHQTGSAEPKFLVNLNGVLYFTADDGENGRELWRSDGTAGGTVMVRDINPGSVSSSPAWLTPLGNLLYFTALGPVSGDPQAQRSRQLWRSDGTAAGTVLVAVINPTGDCEVLPAGTIYFDLKFPVLDGAIYLRASDGLTGNELWRSDGTGNGTFLVKNINPGPAGSDPYFPRVLNGKLVFHATHASYGNELWVYDPNQPVSKSGLAGTGASPSHVQLDPISPNPASASATAHFSLGEAALLRLSLCDMFGREVRLLENEARGEGRHTIRFDTEGLPAGNYLMRLISGGMIRIRPVTVLH